MRILKDRFEFKDLVAHVLTFDYLGALAPRCCSRSCWCRSWGWCARRCCSASSTPLVALWSHVSVRDAAGARAALRAACVVRRRAARRRAWLAPERITAAAEDNIYADEVIFARDTRVPAHRAHAMEGRPPAVPEHPPAVQLARRVPLSRGAGAPGPGGGAGARGACWCSAAATGWRCARS